MYQTILKVVIEKVNFGWLNRKLWLQGHVGSIQKHPPNNPDDLWGLNGALESYTGRESLDSRDGNHKFNWFFWPKKQYNNIVIQFERITFPSTKIASPPKKEHHFSKLFEGLKSHHQCRSLFSSRRWGGSLNRFRFLDLFAERFCFGRGDLFVGNQLMQRWHDENWRQGKDTHSHSCISN